MVFSTPFFWPWSKRIASYGNRYHVLLSWWFEKSGRRMSCTVSGLVLKGIGQGHAWLKFKRFCERLPYCCAAMSMMLTTVCRTSFIMATDIARLSCMLRASTCLQVMSRSYSSLPGKKLFDA